MPPPSGDPSIQVEAARAAATYTFISSDGYLDSATRLDNRPGGNDTLVSPDLRYRLTLTPQCTLSFADARGALLSIQTHALTETTDLDVATEPGCRRRRRRPSRNLKTRRRNRSRAGFFDRIRRPRQLCGRRSFSRRPDGLPD